MGFARAQPNDGATRHNSPFPATSREVTAITRSSRPPAEPEPHGLLNDKVAVVTAGAGAGIGLATAKRCLEEGATVLLSDLHEGRLASAAEQLSRSTGGTVKTKVCDVTVEDDVNGLYQRAIEEFGRIDIAINNAGRASNVKLIEMEDSQWNSVLNVSLTGTFRCMRAVLRHMTSVRQGVVVNVASVTGWRAQANRAHYAAAKAGVMALTRCAAAECAEAGVRVNAVAPSLVMNPFLDRIVSAEELEQIRERELFRRSAETWEVANVIVFLASEYSSYMSGEVVSVSSQHP